MWNVVRQKLQDVTTSCRILQYASQLAEHSQIVWVSCCGPPCPAGGDVLWAARCSQPSENPNWRQDQDKHANHWDGQTGWVSGCEPGSYCVSGGLSGLSVWGTGVKNTFTFMVESERCCIMWLRCYNVYTSVMKTPACRHHMFFTGKNSRGHCIMLPWIVFIVTIYHVIFMIMSTLSRWIFHRGHFSCIFGPWWTAWWSLVSALSPSVYCLSFAWIHAVILSMSVYWNDAGFQWLVLSVGVAFFLTLCFLLPLDTTIPMILGCCCYGNVKDTCWPCPSLAPVQKPGHIYHGNSSTSAKDCGKEPPAPGRSPERQRGVRWLCLSNHNTATQMLLSSSMTCRTKHN